MTAWRVLNSPSAIGEHIAPQLLARIAKARQSGRTFLLGLPTGRTPQPIYEAVANALADSSQDFSHVTLVMMDEYLVRSSNGFDYAPADAPWSCHRFVQIEIVQRLNAHLAGAHRLQEAAIWFPDPRDPAAYDARIADAGGIDFFLLASGATDGHVAFNPPGSERNSRTRIIELPESTRKDNLQTFPSFGSLEAVPTHGISVGIDTIASAREAVMVVWGVSKALTLRRMLATEEYDRSWPATVIHECATGEILSDAAVASTPAKP